MSDEEKLFTPAEIESMISEAEQEGDVEIYESDFRFLPRQADIPEKLMARIVDHLITAISSGEYFDGGMRPMPSYIEEVLNSPSITKKLVNRFYKAVFKGNDEIDPLEEIIREDGGDGIMIGSDEFFEFLEEVKAKHN